jgi:hypothetical protein
MDPSCLSIEEEMAREERLIRILEAELSALDGIQKQREAAAATVDRTSEDAIGDKNKNAGADYSISDSISDDIHGSDEEDALNWIIQNQQDSVDDSMSTLLASLQAHERKEYSVTHGGNLHRLQPVVRHFCFTSVQRLPTPTTVAAEAARSNNDGQLNNNIVSYMLRGYFLANRSVQARIQMDVSLLPPSSADSSLSGSGGGRILSLQCHIESSSASSSSSHANENEGVWSWLDREVRVVKAISNSGSGDVNNIPSLAAWMEAVTSFLQFHDRRQRFLSQLQLRYNDAHLLDIEQYRSRTILSICIPGRNQQQRQQQQQQQRPHDHDDVNETGLDQRRTFSLVWGWKWQQGRDVIRLTETATALGLKQPHLDALVQVCEDRCDRAIELMLRQVQHDDSDDDDSNCYNDNQNKNTATTTISNSTTSSSRDRVSSKDLKNETGNIPPAARKRNHHNNHVDADDEGDRDVYLDGAGHGSTKTTNAAASAPRASKKEEISRRRRRQLQERSMPCKKRAKVRDRPTPCGYQPPKRRPTQAPDGSYKRPAGKGPLGYFWDDRLGLWASAAAVAK